jgi:hypothetical protein
MFLTMDASALHRAFKQAHPLANREIICSTIRPSQTIWRFYHLPSFGAPLLLRLFDFVHVDVDVEHGNLRASS